MTLKPHIHEKVINHLALISCHQGGSAQMVSWELTQIPVAIVIEVIDELEGGGWRSRDRLPLLELLSYDPRPAVKLRTARAIRPDIRLLPAERAHAVLTRLTESAKPPVNRPN